MNSQSQFMFILEQLQHTIDLAKMARNIKRTHTEANPDLKRQYIALFFDKSYIKDGKINAALPSEELEPVLKDGRILDRVKNNWLPRVDSNHGHPPYKCPRLSSRLGLSHSPFKKK